ncbi:MAG: 3-carboxy-cis,cis-muconate cycloisomerase [Cytophagales bacterium]|nr:MAG: 3-carboxy-cis,cis-muconate cycloisomerase [Cytophagales bacterium]
MLADLIFTTPAIETIFSDETELRLMLDVERHLVGAQAHVGDVPDWAAQVIDSVCAEPDWAIQHIREQVLLAGNPAIPLVNLLRARVTQQNPEAAQFVHRGATSQDVIDTALMGQLRLAFALFEAELERLVQQLRALDQTHGSAPMIARTLLQQALPFTFGDKLAGWLDGLERTHQTINQLKTSTLSLQLGGPIGTGKSLGEHRERIYQLVADALGLTNPPRAWHTQRDRIATLASALGTLNGLLGKLATDVTLLMQTEVSEVREGAAEGKGGSSSMPHKRNPVTSTFMVAIAHRTPALVSTVLTTMLQPHERAAGQWHAEWGVLRDLCRLTAANLHHANDLFQNLEIDEQRMRVN